MAICSPLIPHRPPLSCIFTFSRKPGQLTAVARSPQGGVDLESRVCTVHCVRSSPRLPFVEPYAHEGLLYRRRGGLEKVCLSA